MSSATEQSFVGELLAVARPYAVEANPMIVALRSGTCPRHVIRQYAEGLARTAIQFPRELAAVLSICNRWEVRTAILGNLLEEEGIVAYEPGRGVVARETRSHGAMAMRFAAAAGADLRSASSEPELASRWYDAAIRSGNWIGAFAFFSIGFEANIPETFRQVHAALLEHYGFAPEDLEFFTEHMSADERHGREAAELLERVVSPEERALAIDGARRGGLAWWMQHRRLARN